MGKYNNRNCYVLATEEQKFCNTRMLLFHICENGRHEYIVGSYFKRTLVDGSGEHETIEYSWDWGHYFADVVRAVEFWKNEVIGS